MFTVPGADTQPIKNEKPKEFKSTDIQRFRNSVFSVDDLNLPIFCQKFIPSLYTEFIFVFIFVANLKTKEHGT